nr:MAG TPA: copper transport outer membrane protein [Caudoviricetes sp.]
MKNTFKITIATISIILAFSIGLVIGTNSESKHEKDFQNQVTELRKESRKIASLDHYTELPGIYQEKQIKKLDKFVKENKNLTANELYTVQGLTYENCDAYQEFYLTEH